MFDTQSGFLIPDWPAPANVRAMVSTRISLIEETSPKPPSGYEHFNLALHVSDDASKVQKNREKLAHFIQLPNEKILWLNQIHSTEIIDTDTALGSAFAPEADASTTIQTSQACCIMTADCLPVLFCNLPKKDEPQRIAAAHAGWRGLADGILSKTLAVFPNPENVIAWIGPAISQTYFEVGDEVYKAFINKNPDNLKAFIPSKKSQAHSRKWMACLVTLAKIELEKAGIKAVYGGEWCTYQEVDYFYSYRRDGAQSGRIASLIMID